MKHPKRHILSLCLVLSALILPAQTQEQVRKLFNEGNYAEAKPALEKLLKRNPRNGNLNYWYGACCHETGETEKGIPYLQTAAERKVREANYRLAVCLSELYRFEEAQAYWETYFDQLERAKKPTEEFQTAYGQTLVGKQLMRNMQDVTFIDSFVVDKTNFLQHYRLSKEAGTLVTYDRFFNRKSGNGGIVYQTEMKNKIFFSAARKDADSLTTLYTSDLIGNQWGEGTELKGIEAEGNINYPYMLSDGMTFYYAAEGENSLGGYDIFITRYDSENDRFLTAENAGIPFNSPANDYMLVIDEYNNLGWFATDRRQPEGKVCIYVFVPNESPQRIDTEGLSAQAITRRAVIHSIKETWNDERTVRGGKQRLSACLYAPQEETRKGDFEFIIDDLTTYRTLDDFRSPQARELFNRWKQELQNHAALNRRLEEKRESYANGNKSQRQGMTAEILSLEQRVEDMATDISRLEKEARNAEKLFLKR